MPTDLQRRNTSSLKRLRVTQKKHCSTTVSPVKIKRGPNYRYRVSANNPLLQTMLIKSKESSINNQENLILKSRKKNPKKKLKISESITGIVSMNNLKSKIQTLLNQCDIEKKIKTKIKLPKNGVIVECPSSRKVSPPPIQLRQSEVQKLIRDSSCRLKSPFKKYFKDKKQIKSRINILKRENISTRRFRRKTNSKNPPNQVSHGGQSVQFLSSKGNNLGVESRSKMKSRRSKNTNNKQNQKFQHQQTSQQQSKQQSKDKKLYHIPKTFGSKKRRIGKASFPMKLQNMHSSLDSLRGAINQSKSKIQIPKPVRLVKKQGKQQYRQYKQQQQYRNRQESRYDNQRNHYDSSGSSLVEDRLRDLQRGVSRSQQNLMDDNFLDLLELSTKVKKQNRMRYSNCTTPEMMICRKNFLYPKKRNRRDRRKIQSDLVQGFVDPAIMGSKIELKNFRDLAKPVNNLKEEGEGTIFAIPYELSGEEVD